MHLPSWFNHFKTYYWVHLFYYIVVDFFFATVVWAIEFNQNGFTWLDCLFTVVSAHTVTGLGVLNFTLMHTSTKFIAGVLICFGGQIGFALVPLMLKRWHFLWINQPKVERGLTRRLITFFTTSTEVKIDFLDSKYVMFRTNGLLVRIILFYAFVINFFAILLLAVYSRLSNLAKNRLDDRGVSPMYFSTFTTTSALNNAGFSVFSDSLVPFADNSLILIVAMILIVVGNTGFPILLRWLVVLLHKLHVKTKGKSWITRLVTAREDYAHKSNKLREVKTASSSSLETESTEVDYNEILFKSLLRHPRVYTTHLFEPYQTYILLAVLLITNIAQFILYTSVRFESGQLSVGEKTLAMAFTTISTRTAGFNVIDLQFLNPGIIICQIMLMYLSSYPLIIALQSTSVKETNSEIIPKNTSSSKGKGVTFQEQEVQNTSQGAKAEIKAVLSNDMLWLAGGCVIIAFDPFISLDNLFRVVWEVTSAYGTVGSSLAIIGQNGSFCSSFHAPAKLVVIAIMLIGRHRSVPKNLDAAVETIVSSEELLRRKSLLGLGFDVNLYDLAQKNNLPIEHGATIGHCVASIPLQKSDTNYKTSLVELQRMLRRDFSQDSKKTENERSSKSTLEKIDKESDDEDEEELNTEKANKESDKEEKLDEKKNVDGTVGIV